jgi:transcriptional regulator with XRE-family HTH domain
LNNVRAARLKSGLTQGHLAVAAGTTQQQIQRTETGQKVSLELACRIAGALKAGIADLFPEETKAIRTDTKIANTKRLQKRGIEHSRTMKETAEDARGIVKALEDAGFIIARQPPRS